jgi:hypothetical protein
VFRLSALVRLVLATSQFNLWLANCYFALPQGM